VELIPAIDLLGGKVVRLLRGAYENATVYDDDPPRVARRFRDEGARRLHVVDLDGARDGTHGNRDVLRAIVAAVPELAVQVGGGIRDRDAALAWLELCVARVVLGTSAMSAPDVVRALCAERPGKVIVALDARHGEVAVAGWKQGSGRSVDDVARDVDGWGAAAILFTAIERDGTGEGPDVARTAALAAALRTQVIASGGVGSLAHVRALAQAHVPAVVVGRALYDGAFTLRDALAAAEEGG